MIALVGRVGWVTVTGSAEHDIALGGVVVVVAIAMWALAETRR